MLQVLYRIFLTSIVLPCPRHPIKRSVLLISLISPIHYSIEVATGMRNAVREEHLRIRLFH